MKEEGRRKKEEGRRKKEEGVKFYSLSSLAKWALPLCQLNIKRSNGLRYVVGL
jgi:hypothetical protein